MGVGAFLLSRVRIHTGLGFILWGKYINQLCCSNGDWKLEQSVNRYPLMLMLSSDVKYSNTDLYKLNLKSKAGSDLSCVTVLESRG